MPALTVGGALRRLFDILRHQAGTLLALAAALDALPSALYGLATRPAALPHAAPLRIAADGAGSPGIAFAVLYGLAGLVVPVLTTLLPALSIAWVAHGRSQGRPASFGDGVAAALRVLPGGLGALAIVGIGTLLGLLLLVVPGVMLVLRWAVALPALAVEGLGAPDALARSRDLTRGHRWAVFGFLLSMAVVSLAVSLIAAVAAALLSHARGGAPDPLAAAAGAFVGGTLLAALNGASTAALYLELRRCAEGDRAA